MKLAALGTAGYLPAAGRQTMSFLLATGTETLLLDAGSGVARLLELEPKFCDVIARRWQTFTGLRAIRESDGHEFDALAARMRAA